MKEKKYKAFEGITVVYWDVHRKEALVTYPASDQFIEISHCREGRVELESSGEFVYLGSGDMAITVKKQACENIRFPMGHYHGISVFIDLKKAPMCFSSLLSGVEINPKNVVVCLELFLKTYLRRFTVFLFLHLLEIIRWRWLQ